MWNGRVSRSSTTPHEWPTLEDSLLQSDFFFQSGLARGSSSPITIPERATKAKGILDIKFSPLMLQACDPAMGVYDLQAALRLTNEDARKLLIACISKMKADHEARQDMNFALQSFQTSLFSSELDFYRPLEK